MDAASRMTSVLKQDGMNGLIILFGNDKQD